MGPRDYPPRRPRNQSSDYHGRLIASKSLKLETKRYYIDIKETDRFMFLKLTEIETGGKKSKITLDLQSAADFHFMLTEFNEFYTNLGPRVSNAGRRDELPPLKSDTFTSKDRKLFLDLKENRWGRFLKVTMSILNPSREKHKLVIPAQGMTDLIDAFTELLSEADTIIKKEGNKKGFVSKGTLDHKSFDKENSRMDVSEGDGGAGPGGAGGSSSTSNYNKVSGGEVDKKTSLSSGDQSIEVNINKNAKGTFLRITEINDNIEKSIGVPQDYWVNFMNKLREMTNVPGMHQQQHQQEQQQQQEDYQQQQQEEPVYDIDNGDNNNNDNNNNNNNNNGGVGDVGGGGNNDDEVNNVAMELHDIDDGCMTIVE